MLQGCAIFLMNLQNYYRPSASSGCHYFGKLSMTLLWQNQDDIGSANEDYDVLPDDGNP